MKNIRNRIAMLWGVGWVLWSVPALATLTLKQVQALEGGRVEVVFDGKINKSQVQTDFFGDTVQLTFRDAGVYPAKISNLNGHSVTKIFAYQYAPRVVRLRLSVRGKAEDYRNKLDLEASGRTLAVVMNAMGSSIKQQDQVQVSSAKTSVATSATNFADDEDQALASRIAKAEASPSAKEEPKHLTKKSENTPLAGGKPMSNPFAVFGKLIIVLVAFVAVALGARKFLLREARGGIAGKLGKRLGKMTGFKSKSPIEVLATHYLGPKKSIAVVKVGGRNLVLGITDESINLITQLGAGADAEDEAEGILDQLTGMSETRVAQPERSESSSFEKTLGQAAANPVASKAKISSVRSQIRSRLEGLKQL